MAHTPVNEIVAARRPRRADARRNYDALLLAAREAFAAHGADASLEDIARRAGVGIGTLYRNFPSRTELFEAVYADEVHALCLPPTKSPQSPLASTHHMAAPLRRLHGHQTRDPRCNGHTISRVHLLPRLHVRSRHPLLTRAQTAA